MTRNEKIYWGIAATLAGVYGLYRYEKSIMTSPEGAPPWLSSPGPVPPLPVYPSQPQPVYPSQPQPANVRPNGYSTPMQSLVYAPTSPLESHVPVAIGDTVRIEASSNAPELAIPGALASLLWSALQSQLPAALPGQGPRFTNDIGELYGPNGSRILYFQLRDRMRVSPGEVFPITRVLSALNGAATGTITGVSRA